LFQRVYSKLPASPSIKLSLNQKNWIDTLTRHSLPRQYQAGTFVLAVGQQENRRTSSRSFERLGGLVDFLFVPALKPFVIYADHDEYTAFYAKPVLASTESPSHC